MNFNFMFSSCSSLSDIKPLEKWNVSNCTNFSLMFSGCSIQIYMSQLENWKKINKNFK